MTALVLSDLARDLSAQPEPKFVCDADGNWHTEQRVRIRTGNGWTEYRVIDVTAIEDGLIQAVKEALE